MKWRSKWNRSLGLILGVFVWVVPVSAWAGSPKKKSPNEARLREVEKLTEDYLGLYREEKYREAAMLAEQACAILVEEHGSKSIEIAECLNDLGVLYSGHGVYEKAELLYERALAIRERALGPEHPDVAMSLETLAALYVHQGVYEKAEPLHQRALAIFEKALGPDHPHVATSLSNLAELYRALGKYEKAEPMYERALAVWKKASGPDHPDVATGLNNLALLYEHQGEYENAVPLFERALAICEKALGPEHPKTATTLNNLAVLYEHQGAYVKAAGVHERALAVLEKALGPDHPNVAQSLSNMALLLDHQGEYARAEPLYKRALIIQEKALGLDHPSVAMSLNNLASLYKHQGAYAKAEPLLERTLIIRERALGPDHSDVAMSLNNLASLYRSQGAYSRAEPLLERALAIWKDTLGPEHPNVASSLSNLASLYFEQGEYERAKPVFEQALAISEEALGPEHPSVATNLNALAALYHHQGAYEKVGPLYERAVVIYEKALGREHPHVAVSLSNLAVLYEDQGAHEKAEPLYERALVIRERAQGSSHPHVALSLGNLARFYYRQGNLNRGSELHRRALDIEEINLVRTLTVADEARRLAYGATLSSSLHYALSLHLRITPEHAAIAELALTILLRRKNRVQDLVAQTNAVFRRSLPEDDRHLLDKLSEIDSQVAVLSSRGPGPLTVDAYAQQLDELGKMRDQLWSELAKHSTLVEVLNHPVTIEDIQRRLHAGSALVELVQYLPEHDDAGVRLRPHEPQLPLRYAAYLVFPDHFDWVDLGPAAPIDEHVDAFRKALQTKQAIPTDLYDVVMRPIVEKLGSANHLIIAPAGNLSLIPFGAFHDSKQYLIEKYDLRYVTTGRDLLAPPATPPVTTTPVTIVANPSGANLPDAELEADFLASLFPHTRLLLDEQATETNVRTIERPLVLHMATHGFFGDALNERDNPLFRSGLYLADIDQVEVDRERDDGQLTAYEVSGMDLRGTQLVVLSACETGMGATDVTKTDVGGVDMNEGVFGLRRAFAMAGARTTVMSLWEVSGVTTQKTMEPYYRRLAEGMGRGEAMQAVQLEMLRSEEHAHPKDWAAFIVSGDDTPMVFPEGEEPRVEEPQQPGPPPVRRPRGCAMAAPSPDRDPLVPAFLPSLLGLGVLLRRRRA